MNRLLAPLGILFLGFSGCLINSFVGIEGNGVKKTEDRPVGAFRKVSFSGQGTYRLAPGAKPALQISGDENLLPYVETETVGEELKIGMKSGSYSWKQPLQGDIAFQQLTGIKAQGQVNLDGQGWDGGNLDVRLEGQTNMSLSGKVDTLTVRIDGQSGYRAAGLIAKKVKLICNGQCSVSIHATEEVEIQANGMCTVELHGKPAKKVIDAQGLSKVVEK